MIKKIISILAYFSIGVCIIEAQTLDLTQGTGLGARLRSQPILPTEGRVNQEKLLNLRTQQFIKSNSGISGNGHLLLLDNQLIKGEGSFFRKINTPFSNDNKVGRMKISVDGRTAVLPRQPQFSSDIDIHYFDIESEKIELTITIPPIGSLLFNSDLSIFIYAHSTNSELLFNIVERNGNGFNTTPVIVFTNTSELTAPHILYFSSSGDRILFSATLRDTGEKEMFILDRLETGWSEPREWQATDEQGNAHDLLIIDIANNGRTLLLSNINVGLMLSHEVNGKWSVPEPTGYIPKLHDAIEISENGKVISLQTIKRTTPEFWFYDVFVLLQNPAGKWIKHQINDPQFEVWDGILLSDDGTQLYWLPANTSSVPNAEEYR